MKTYREFVDEGLPTVTAGGGDIAGIGVGPDGEPGVPPSEQRKRRRKERKKQKRKWDSVPSVATPGTTDVGDANPGVPLDYGMGRSLINPF